MSSGSDRSLRRSRWLSALACVCLGAGLGCGRKQAPGSGQQASPSASTTSPAQPGPELATLRDEVARLQRLVPSQSHAMQDVGYHFTNPWFAGQKHNWPLAGFYLAETRQHLKWAVRIIPVRKTEAGDVDLDGIREAFDTSSLAEVQQAIDAKDAARFGAAYKLALEGCYSCHKASEKPFLRLQVPARPEVQIINFDPGVRWPQ
jgi:hypothetical protein